MSIAEKLTQIAEKQQRVYGAGFTAGQAQGGGGTDDAFWDAIQDNGNRLAYPYIFLNWTDEFYNPKYPIVCNGSSSYKGVNGTYAAWGAFANSSITDTKVPITLTKTRADNVFDSCINLRIIRSLTVNNLERFSNTFRKCGALEELNLYGTVDINGFDLQHSIKLNKESIESVIGCLSTTTSGLTVTLSKTAVESAFGSITATEWVNLKNSRSNWTISLK